AATAAAAPMARAASTGSMGAVAAGGAGPAKTSSCVPAISSGAAQAGQARQAGPSSLHAQGNGSGMSASAQPCPSLPRRPPEINGRQDVTRSATLAQQQSPHAPHPYHPPPPQPLPQPQQQQEDAARPLSRLSLSSRVPRQQGRPSRMEPSAVAMSAGTGDGGSLPAMDIDPAERRTVQGDGANEPGLLGDDGGSLPRPLGLAAGASASSSIPTASVREGDGLVRNGNGASDRDGEVAGTTTLGAAPAEGISPLGIRGGGFSGEGGHMELDFGDRLGVACDEGGMESGFAEADDWA
ncbi:hypothetical protein Vretimale_987, partial [Volvox reticuliferus]